MYQSSSNAINAYGVMGKEGGIESANPHKLILMLYDGAVLALSLAASQLEQGDKQAMSNEIMRASRIISLGLLANLNPKIGGDLSLRLAALYTYMEERLQMANIKCDIEIINEINGLLKDLRGAWEEIADDPAVVSFCKERG